jgi:hypothetical protein
MRQVRRQGLSRLFLIGALVSAIAAFLLILAPCDEPDIGDLLAIVVFWLLLGSGVLTGCAVLTRARKPRGWKGWGRLLVLFLVALVAAMAVVAIAGALWFVLDTIRCEGF